MKKLFFNALIAVVAISGAFVGNAQSSMAVRYAGILDDPSSLCDIAVPCSPVAGPACILEEDGPQYFKNYPLPTGTGKCSIFLSRDLD